MLRANGKCWVVDVRTAEFDVYIGRSYGQYKDQGFGNPFAIGVMGDRTHVLKLYKRWLWNRIKTDAQFRRAVRELHGKTLGCWCKGQPCHGHVLACAAKWLQTHMLEVGHAAGK